MAGLDTAKALRDRCRITACTSIGLGDDVMSLQNVGWRPIRVFALVVILAVGVMLASLLFREFSV